MHITTPGTCESSALSVINGLYIYLHPKRPGRVFLKGKDVADVEHQTLFSVIVGVEVVLFCPGKNKSNCNLY
jgi:hypothetical protein